MKLFVYLGLIFLGLACSHTLNKAVDFKENQAKPIEEEVFKSPTDKYFVPKILFQHVDEYTVTINTDKIKTLTDAGADAIVIEWNTLGGNVDEGLKLSKVIEESKIPIICVVDGDSDSMGMFLLQSCQVRMMTKRSKLMIHEAAYQISFFHGYSSDFQSYADRLKAINNQMAEHIGKRMGMKPKVLLEKIKNGAQWWMNWEEAKKYHAVDTVVESTQEVTDSYRQHLKMGPLNCAL